MKVLRSSDKKWLWYCPGCERYHFCDERWTFNGDQAKPTFHPSVKVSGYCGKDNQGPEAVCHTYVTDGKIQFLPDCTHKLAGQTVEMQEED